MQHTSQNVGKYKRTNIPHMIMVKTYLTIIISLLSTAIISQNVNLEWAMSLGAINDDYQSSITTDISGNIYVTGYYRGTVDFDPSAVIFDLTSNSSGEFFVQKLDPNGNLIWVKTMNGTSNSSSRFIISDKLGNVYITGHLRGTTDFDPGPATFNLTANGVGDIFIQKLDSNGDFVWAKNIGGSANDESNSISLDGANNLYVTGQYIGTVDFAPGTTTFNLISNGSDVFVLKLDSNGNFIWAKSIGGPSYEDATSISTDSLGNIYLTGHFQGTADFDPSSATYNITSNGYADYFIQKLDSAGNFIWAKSIGNSSSDFIITNTIDASGNVYSSGVFNGTIDLDPGSSTFSVTSNGLDEIFIQKLDNNGNFVWAKSIGGTGYDVSNSISADVEGNIYITGHFQGIADFDPGLNTYYLSSIDTSDAFIQKLDYNGNFIWAKSVGGYSFETGTSITSDSSGNIYVSGEFLYTADFDPNVSTYNLTSNGGSDIFVLKLSQIPVNAQENDLISHISIYPNPFQDILTISIGHLTEISINVLDINGRSIDYKENINTAIYQLKINNSPGVYFIEVINRDEKQTYKLVKQ